MLAHLPELALMPIRRHELEAALAGLQATGVPLVGRAAGHLVPAGAPDAPGLYFFVPLCARLLGLSLDDAITVFVGGIVLAGALTGIIGWLRYARAGSARAFGVTGILAVSAVALFFGDSYAVAAALVLGCVPLLLAGWRRGSSGRSWAVTLALVGLLAGVAGATRTGSDLPVVLFAAVLTLARTRIPWPGRAALLAVLVAATLVPAVAANRLMAHRDAYLAARIPGYLPPVRAHVLWHSAYIGFGFLTNDRGITYRDGVAMGKVASVDPNAVYGSRRYEAILRGEVLRLVLHSPGYVARTIAAKLGVLAGYLLLFANLGLVAAWRARKRDAADAAFAAALALAALPGLIAIPVLQYLEGFAALALFYGAVGVERWRSAGRPAAAPPPRSASAAPLQPVSR